MEQSRYTQFGRNRSHVRGPWEGVVAKLHITETGAYTGGPLSCEHNVNITADTIRFDGCRDRNIVLSFDAGDTVYPLKSKSKSETGYIFKAKVK